MIRFRAIRSLCINSNLCAVPVVKHPVLGLLAVALLAGVALGQDPAAGILPFSTQIAGAYESIDLATSNIVVSIPVRNKTGKIPFSYNLVMNSHAYSWYGQGGTQRWQWVVSTSPVQTNPPVNFQALSGRLSAGPLLSSVPQTCQGNAGYITKFYVRDLAGTNHITSTLSHPINLTGDSLCGTNGGFPETVTTTDGSGYTVVVSGVSQYTTYDKSGSLVPWPAAPYVYVQDPDGAQIKAGSLSGSIIDTLGAQTLTVSSSPNNSGVPGVYQWTDAGENTQKIQVNYSQKTQQTNFGCPNVHDIAATSVYLPTSVTTPSGNFTITYEPTPNVPANVTGRIASLTYPTGGKVSYTYAGGNNNTGIICEIGVVPTLTRKVYEPSSNTTSTWTYVNSNTGSTGNYQVTVSDPANNQTQYTFAVGYQTQRLVYEGTISSGTLLETVITCYDGSNSSKTGCINAVGFPYPNVTQTDVYTSLNGSSSQSLVETVYDCKSTTTCYGNITSVSAYTFGATFPPSGSPVSQTTTTYDIASGGTYPCGALATLIFDRPCSVTTVDSSGATRSQVKYTYDSKGHPITTARWVSGTGANAVYLASSTSYTSNGTVNVATDVNTTTSTYSYSGVCASVMPTGVLISGLNVSLSRSMTWDCNGGVQTALTDKNNNNATTTTNFASGSTADPYYRPISVVDPLSNTSSFGYSPTTFESAMNFDTISTSDTLITTDGLGRPILSQTRQSQGSSNYDSTQTAYGWISANTGACTTQPPFKTGACTAKSMPYPGTVGQFAPGGTAVTTTQYDALHRPVTVTDGGGGTVSYTYVNNDVLQSVGTSPTFQKQLEYDGLGRLTRVCEITAVTGSGSCGESNPANGFLTIYSYDAIGNLLSVTQNAQPGAVGGTQSRTYAYDGLSRLTSETNPEWGPGTANYTYDVACGTFAASAGDLTTKVDNAGNTTCYGYDALHRVTDVMVYKAGACYPPVKRFRYDNTTNAILPAPSGYPTTTSSNTGGRMVEAWTGDCVWPTPASGYDSATDEWFAYSVRGEMTDLWESTTHILGYYHGTASYAPNGAIASVGGVPGYTAITYGLDGEGRPNTATQGTTNLVTGVAYTSASQPKTISFGTGDSDSYLYDPNTGRMTTYTFTVNGVTDSGGLTWNANGTLGQLVIMDHINSGGSQTCVYGSYDDLGRLVNANCGSVWSQTFSYDPFGNITKTGSSQWMPGYNETTNHAMLPFTYDNNGNMTNDTFHKYGWYVDNKLGSIDSTTCNIFGNSNGTCVLYDAFGREVERAVNAVYTEVMYTPVGKTAVMNGETTTVSAYFPLPGGGTYFQSGSTGANGYFWHKDWLGSVRLSSSLQTRTSYFDRAFAPYGEMYNNFGNTGGVNFTGDTQDSFVGLLFDTPNRELHPGEGRWISPDPSGLNAVDPANPQSWNRYAYVLNNPLSYIDSLGLDCVFDNGDGTTNVVRGNGDCAGDNAFYFEGTVSNASVDANNNVVASVNGELKCAGDSGCSIYDNLTTITVNEETASQIAFLPSPSEIASDVINRPITTATISNVPNGKEQYCQSRADDAAKNAVLPGLSTRTGVKNSAELAMHYGAEVAEGSTALKLAVRSYTGVAMSTTGKLLTGLGAASIAYSSYEALKAAQEEYKACVSE